MPHNSIWLFIYELYIDILCRIAIHSTNFNFYNLICAIFRIPYLYGLSNWSVYRSLFFINSHQYAVYAQLRDHVHKFGLRILTTQPAIGKWHHRVILYKLWGGMHELSRRLGEARIYTRNEAKKISKHEALNSKPKKLKT